LNISNIDSTWARPHSITLNPKQVSVFGNVKLSGCKESEANVTNPKWQMDRSNDEVSGARKSGTSEAIPRQELPEGEGE
jgi:hypothetical protein